jgi:hypothetical protein
MKRFLALSAAFVFAGLSFAEPPQSTGSFGQNPAAARHQRHIEWCKQHWDKCKERKLKWLSVKQDCLQKSQSFEDFRGCVDQARKQFREQIRQEMKEMKK